MTISLEGIASNIDGEERALAYLKVEHNGQTYDWQVYVPPEVSWPEFLASREASIYAEIAYKEAQWTTLEPKTRESTDPMTGETTVTAIDKSEIVRPEVPDYYARRRAEYPSLGDQLDAQWKGGAAMQAMLDKIAAVKQKYPKPVWLL